MENYICPNCGEIMESTYDEANQRMFLSCCGEEYDEDEFEKCFVCGDYHHIMFSNYDESQDRFICYECGSVNIN